MAITEKGIYYPNDGTKVADILTDMKKMAESIDKTIEENEFDPSQLNQSIINLQQNVTNLQESQTAQDNEIDQIKGTLANKETEIAKNIHIEDAEGFGKLSILGNYEQNGEPSEENPVEITCLGDNKKNLFSLDNKLENAQIDYFDETIENSSDYDTYYIELEEGQSFVLSLKFSNDYYKTAISSWGYLSEIPVLGASFDWDKIGRSSLGEINNKAFTAKRKYFVISILREILPYIYDIQVEKGTVATSFVPYGQGSTEIKIENSDKTQDLTYVLPIQQEMLKGDVFSKELDGWKELHNWQKIDSYNGENITTDYISTTGSLTTGATVFYKLQTPKKIPCTEEQSKILNQLNALDLFEGVNDITTTENIALLQLKYVSNVDEVDILKEEIEDLKDNQIHIKTEQSSTINVQDCSNLSAKIDVYGVSSQETRSGKNKLVYPYKDLSGSIIEDLGDGRLLLNGTIEKNTAKTIKTFNLKAGKYKIIFNKELLPNQAYFLLLNVDNGEYIINGLRQEGTFELSEDANVRLSLVLITGTYSNYELDLMILESTQQDETFEQYGASPSPKFPSEIENVEGDIDITIENEDKSQTQTIIFPLQEGQKLYRGSYLTNDGIHHDARKQVELDGTEDITIFDWTTPHTKTTMFKVTNIIAKKSDSIKFCNYFKVVKNTGGNLNKDEEYCLSDVTGAVFFSISNEIATTVEQFKTWLSQKKQGGNPIIAEYQLLEEEIETYTEAQQEAYDQLQNVTPYKLVTNISTDKAKLQFNYIADTKTYIDNKVNNMQNQLNTINELLSTANTSAMLLDNLQTDLESEVL